MGILLCVIMLSAAGCGEDSTFPLPDNYETKESADQTRKRIAFVEARVSSLEVCTEVEAQVNEKQKADIAGLRHDLDTHRQETRDALGRIRAPQFSEEEKQAIKDELKRRKDERAAAVGGSPSQSAHISIGPKPFSPSPSDSYSSPMPQPQGYIVEPQQPVQRKVWGYCGKCCRYHWHWQR